MIFSLIVIGPNFLFDQISQLFITLTTPFGNDRWQLTVAEAHQPYLMDLINQVGWKFFWIYMIGSIIIFYKLMNRLNKKTQISATIIYTLFVLGFMFNRYSPNAKILNGDSFFSKYVAYFGTLFLLIIVLGSYYFYSYYKNKETFKKILKLNKKYLFILVWFFVMLVASRSAIRLYFIFSVIIVVFVAYSGIKLFDYSLKFKKDYQKIGTWILLFLLFVSPFSISSLAFGIFDKGIILDHSQKALNQAKFSGLGYDQQWQLAGKWVRENTDKNAVFSHWWDYGYWVQTNFERATVTDGGNAKSSLNYFM